MKKSMPWSGGTVPAAADGTGRRCRRPGKHQCKLAACRPVAGAADPHHRAPSAVAAAAAGPRCAGAGTGAADLLPVGSPWRLSPWLPGGGGVVMRQMAREEQEAAVPPMPHRPAPQQPAAPKSAPQPEKAPTPPACGGKKPAPSGSRKAGIARPGNTGPRRPGLSGGEAGRAGHRSAVGGDQADVAHFFRKPNNPFFLIGPGADTLHLIAGLADGGPQGLLVQRRLAEDHRLPLGVGRR